MSKENVNPSLDQIDFALINETIQEWTKPLPPEYIDIPLVVAGPSGVGKNRLIRSVIKDYSKFFERVVTHTTRDPRPLEINGSDYYFVSIETYKILNSSGYFLENSMVHNNYYGISYESWQKVKNSKKISIFEIDIQGARVFSFSLLLLILLLLFNMLTIIDIL
jgi:guanylate kinase